ncbi:MAG: hypothetical protein JST80_01270 [Bdellovibrionales bacterium]|nr:hypothetical protein [Bdellovibrionales bacterium]
MKQFLSVKDATNIDAMIAKGIEYKSNPLKDKNLGAGKRIGLLFMNPSMRTRMSSQIAARNLGMEAFVLNMGTEGWALEFADGAVMNGTTVEHIKDAAPILAGFFDVIALRTFPKLQNRAEDESDVAIKALIKHSGVPVVSLESSTRHPLQSLADLITIKENFKPTATKKRPKVVLTWAPHIKPIPHCVANSFAEWVNAWGEADFVITNPEGYDLSKEYTGKAPVTHNQKEALDGADFVYVKNWSTYGTGGEDYGRILAPHPEWMLMQNSFSSPDTKVMHCLPLRRNVEMSDEVLDSPRSLLTTMGKNRIWSAQAVLSEILKNG